MRYIIVLALVAGVMSVTSEGVRAQDARIPTAVKIAPDQSVASVARFAYGKFPEIFPVVYASEEEFVQRTCEFNNLTMSTCTQEVSTVLPNQKIASSDKFSIELPGIDEAELKAEKLATQVNSLQGELVKREEAMSELDEKLSDAESHVADLKEQLAVEEALSDAERRQLQKELAAASERREALLADREKLESQITDARIEIQSLEQERDQLRASIARLQDRLNDLSDQLAETEEQRDQAIYTAAAFLLLAVIILFAYLLLRKEKHTLQGQNERQEHVIENALAKQKRDVDPRDREFHFREVRRDGVTWMEVTLPKVSTAHAQDAESFREKYNRDTLEFLIVDQTENGDPIIEIKGWPHPIPLDSHVKRKLGKALKDPKVVKHYRHASSDTSDEDDA